MGVWEYSKLFWYLEKIFSTRNHINHRAFSKLVFIFWIESIFWMKSIFWEVWGSMSMWCQWSLLLYLQWMLNLTEMLETLLLLALFWAKSVDKWLGCFCALRGWVLAGRRDTSCTFYNNRSLCFSRLKIVFFQFATNTCHFVYIATQCFSFVNFQTICSSKSLVALVTLQFNESRKKQRL